MTRLSPLVGRRWSSASALVFGTDRSGRSLRNDDAGGARRTNATSRAGFPEARSGSAWRLGDRVQTAEEPDSGGMRGEPPA
jgi:hypothetical protein